MIISITTEIIFVIFPTTITNHTVSKYYSTTVSLASQYHTLHYITARI